ncbi:MAG: sensor domain-containing diguanylate cyclase [Armatimonadota bacterium]|nr:sensor domain-containing diguanylate cyclase [Armatimonadota bacterium]
MRASLPQNEIARLNALRRYQVLDTPPERAYDDLTSLATYLCRTPVSLVTFIDETRQWFKSYRGMDVCEMHRDLAFCAHAILEPSEVMVVPDTRLDARFADNTLVTGPPHVRFYAGAALVTPDGFPLGTLCVIDTRPRRLKPGQKEALQALSRQAAAQIELRLLAETRAQKVALEKANRRLQGLATTDGLTGLKNHRALHESLREQFVQARRSGQTFSLMLLDLDNFKQYNDAFGHPAGDQVLSLMAHLLKRCVRVGDVAARHGGEEFSLLLPATDGERAQTIAERLRRTMHQAPWPLRPLTASFGISTYTPAIPDHNRLMIAADDALYRAKAQGRNQICHSFLGQL